MNIVLELLKKEKQHELLLGVIFLLYLVLNLQTPEFVSQLIDTTFGSVVLLLLSLSLFLQVNPIIGVLGMAVAFEMIRRSSVATGSFGVDNYLPSEEKKLRHMKAYDEPNEGRFDTLETDCVEKHIESTNNKDREDYLEASYSPQQSDTTINVNNL